MWVPQISLRQGSTCGHFGKWSWVEGSRRIKLGWRGSQPKDNCWANHLELSQVGTLWGTVQTTSELPTLETGEAGSTGSQPHALRVDLEGAHSLCTQWAPTPGWAPPAVVEVPWAKVGRGAGLQLHGWWPWQQLELNGGPVGFKEGTGVCHPYREVSGRILTKLDGAHPWEARFFILFFMLPVLFCFFQTSM